MTIAAKTDALVVHARHDLRLEHVAVPELGADQVAVHVAWGGICGSDLHYVHHGGVGASVLREPMVLGHEASGIVSQVGSGVPAWKTGDAVAIHPASPCGVCPECAREQRNLCRNVSFLGSAARLPHTGGAFRRELIVHGTQLHALPPGLDLRRAALAEPLSVALHAIARGGDCLGKRVLVQGAGPIGALIVAGLKAAGAERIVAVDLQPFALELACKLGADEGWNAREENGDEEFDIVFEATGVAMALPQAVGRTRRGGILVQVGMFPPGSVEAPLSQVITRELDFRGSFRFDTEFAAALTLLAARPQIADILVTQSYRLEEFAGAFEISLDRSRASKVLLEFG